ncbi:DPP IV N-terminal domain-containing protein, partial [bacterium]|nr:DPP IV N-terminal domain-containing protein [bacterium]
MSSPAGRFRALSLAVAALAVLATPVAAQFGKNKVQYQSFDWYTIETEHFDIYYYKEEEESAIVAARMAERAYTRLSRILDHEIEERVPVIIYASHTDFQQTNITSSLISEGTGGITEFAKRRVFLPFTGSYGEFDHVLSHELVHAFQVDLMFGSGAEANPFAFQPPLWFMEGMAEYLSIGGVDPNTEMWLRWSALDGQLIPLQYMDRIWDIRVYRIGQAIFDFVGERYGDEKIGELLRKTVYFRSADMAFAKTLGMDLEALNEEWESYVRRKYYPQIVDLGRAEDQARRLFGRKGFRGVHVAPSLSPDGDRLVYIKEDRFSKNIELASAIDGKPLDTLVKGETSGDFESLRYMYTAIGWAPDGKRIAFPSKKGGEDVINILDVDSGAVLRTLSFDFDAVYSPAYHPDGRRIVFTGIRGGKSDLYRVDLDDGSLTQITDDPYLARDPQYSPDGRRIAFVTDRGRDTDLENLVFGDPHVALLDVESGEITLLPGQEGKAIAPHWGPDGNFLAFVSDRDGISDLYVQDLRSDRLFRLTNLTTGVTGLIESSPPFSWSRDGRRIVFTTFTGEGWALYGIDDPLERIHEKEIDAPEPLDRIARAEYGTVVPWSAPALRASGATRDGERLAAATPGDGATAAEGDGDEAAA